MIYVQFVSVSLFASCLLCLLKAREHFEDDITYKTWGVPVVAVGQLLYYGIEVHGDYNIDIHIGNL